MSDRTNISWCDRTWSPWEGCTKVSRAEAGGGGCDNCYAEALNKRFRKSANWGAGAPRRKTVDWTKPRLWNREAARAGSHDRVFPSICDPFDNEVDLWWRVDFFRLIAATPHLVWLLLTKRIGNAWPMMQEVAAHCGGGTAPMPNVWLGATVANQAEAERDIPKLLAAPARLRFVSIEPMLGPISFDAVATKARKVAQPRTALEGLDWIITGGESGPHARPLVLAWMRGIVRECKAVGVPVHVKQLGARPTNREGEPHRISDRKGALLSDWPAELRVQEVPHAQP